VATETKTKSKKAAGTSHNNGGTAKASKLKAIIELIRDERFRKSFGIIVLLFSIYLITAITSYMFTWQTDQDKVEGPFLSMLADKNITVDNWLGKVGAFFSHLLIHNGFGISSYLIALLIALPAYKFAFGTTLLPIQKTTRITIFLVIWISVSLGALFHDDYFYLGGVVGYHSSEWLNAAIGNVGTALLLPVVFIVFLIVTFNPKFKVTLPENILPAQDVMHKNIPDHEVVDDHKKRTSDAEQEESEVENSHKFNSPILDTEQLLYQPDKIVEPENTLTKDSQTVPFEIHTHTEEPQKKTSEVEFEVTTPINEEHAEDPSQPTLKQKETSDVDPNLPDYDTEKVVGVEVPFTEMAPYDPTLDLSTYEFPPLDLLEQRGSDTIRVNSAELEANKDKIINTLKNYSIEIKKISATIGPTVTLYEIVPADGVRISKIKNLEDDIALSLSALGIRIIAPIPGKGTIGIEVPNSKPEIVSMRSAIASDKFQNTDFDLPIALGKTISNETFICDLAKMPHLLMAGATGQGKSVGLNAVLVSLLYKKHPSSIKFVLVDPKKVELTLFNIIERHFLAKLPDAAEPIITDTKKVVHTLNSLCIEMDSRYELLKDAQVRNLKEYNAKFISRRLNPKEGHRFLPYIVLVVDEFADLIMTAGKEVEMPIARLAQLARAIGIHLIIATQRPSVNIITGTIKANFPARIAFRVSSKIDSRTILDAGGAEQLIGRGDMLLSTGNDLIRIQCAFVDTPEVEKIAQWIGQQRGYPTAYELPEYSGEDGADKKEEIDLSTRDAYFVESARLIIQHQQGSTSLIQRRLKLGYNRAGRIIDQLEAAGIVGPFEGSKARQVLFSTESQLEEFLQERGFI
jgi:S-DNA-T family DNA segregation ATPase FtsK/SpoIIIE